MNLSVTHGIPTLTNISMSGETQTVDGVIGNIKDGNESTYHGFYASVNNYGLVMDASVNATWYISLGKSFYIDSIVIKFYALSQIKTLTVDWYNSFISALYSVSASDSGDNILASSGSYNPNGEKTLSYTIQKMCSDMILSLSCDGSAFNTNLARTYLRLKEVYINGEEWIRSNAKFYTGSKKYRKLKLLNNDGPLREFDGIDIMCPAIGLTIHPYATPKRVCMLDGVKSVIGYQE